MMKNGPPLLLAGGETNGDFKLLLAKARSIGYTGVCVGRNIFQSQNPHKTVADIREIFGT